MKYHLSLTIDTVERVENGVKFTAHDDAGNSYEWFVGGYPMTKKTPKTVPFVRPEGDKAKPWMSNYPPLKEWIDKYQEQGKAQVMWQLPYPVKPHDAEYDWTPNMYVEMWLINARPVLIIIHANGHGWEIYTSLDTVAIDATLLDVERRVKIKEE